MILEKTFQEIIFGSVDVLPVYGFSKTYIMKVRNVKDYVTLDPDDDDADFRYKYRDTMIAQFKQEFYNKNFSLQDQGKDDQIDTLQNRNKFWPNGIDDTVCPIPDDIYIYDYNDKGMDHSVRGAEIFPEIKELKELLDIIRCEWLRNQKKILNDVFRKGPEKIYPTKKTDVYNIHDNSTLDILHLKDHGEENNIGYRYVIVIIGNF